MPAAVTSWRLPPCDLVVSFSHCVAKAIRPRRSRGSWIVDRGSKIESFRSTIHDPRSTIPHVCYCFTPMRYIWHMQGAYFGEDRVRGVKARALERVELAALGSANGGRRDTLPGHQRNRPAPIAECYGRDSTILYPPVDTDFYHPAAVPARGVLPCGVGLRAVQATRSRHSSVQRAAPAAAHHWQRTGRGASASAGGTDHSLPWLAARYGDPRPFASLSRD